jgi:hypothetical protein
MGSPPELPNEPGLDLGLLGSSTMRECVPAIFRHPVHITVWQPKQGTRAIERVLPFLTTQ